MSKGQNDMTVYRSHGRLICLENMKQLPFIFPSNGLNDIFKVKVIVSRLKVKMSKYLYSPCKVDLPGKYETVVMYIF